ncbi:hypothetical protein [Phocaeicola sartorii]|uniref:hypothetical protein n=1 Tax=Phocaeicola sartorii TaxID=671267 RepID=UPI002432260D|nr:hypothetical protein [Phocaeicola sartorii]
MNEEDMNVKILLSFGSLEYTVHEDTQNSYTVTRTFKFCNHTHVVCWKNVARNEISLLTDFKK